MLSFILPHAVSSVGDKHHGHLVLAIAVHQVAETLLGGRDGGSASHQHAIDVKEEPKRVGVLWRDLGHRGGSTEQREDTTSFINLLGQLWFTHNRDLLWHQQSRVRRCSMCVMLLINRDMHVITHTGQSMAKVPYVNGYTSLPTYIQRLTMSVKAYVFTTEKTFQHAH